MSMDSNQPNKRPTAGTRELVLNQARRLFSQRGFSAVSMRDIAGVVGLQQSSIYNHFDSKQSILMELLRSHMVTLNQRRAISHNESLPAREQMIDFARFHVAYHIDFPDDVFIAYMELRSLEPENREALVQLRDEYELGLREILQRGVVSGDFHCVDVAVHARAIIAMLTGVTVWYQEAGRLDKASVIDSYVTAALQSLGICMTADSHHQTLKEVNHV